LDHYWSDYVPIMLYVWQQFYSVLYLRRRFGPKRLTNEENNVGTKAIAAVYCEK